MTKDELIRAVSENNTITLKESKKIVQFVFDKISDCMAQGERVKISGFGTFEAKKRKAFRTRHPKSGEMIDVPESIQPSFEPSRQLKEKVNKNNEA